MDEPTRPRIRRRARAPDASAPPKGDTTRVSTIVAALERAWAALARAVPELPDVAITVASGGEGHVSRRCGYWSASRWPGGRGDRRGELLVSAERLGQGSDVLLEMLLHEAVHVLAQARGVADTSRQGRYHNETFRELAHELRLRVDRDGTQGWSLTRVSDEALSRYRETLTELDGLEEYRRQVEATGAEAGAQAHTSRGTGGGERLLVVCGCPRPRKLRVSRATLDAGPICCGVCDRNFVDAKTLEAGGRRRRSRGSGRHSSTAKSAHQVEAPDAAAPGPGVEFDLPSFARIVLTTAQACPTGRFGPNKVFTHHVWSQLEGFPGIGDLAAFKQQLIAANRAGLLSLSRADLVQAMAPDDVRQAEIDADGALFHFVRHEA